MSLVDCRYKNVVEKKGEDEIFFLDLRSGGFTDFLMISLITLLMF